MQQDTVFEWSESDSDDNVENSEDDPDYYQASESSCDSDSSVESSVAEVNQASSASCNDVRKKRGRGRSRETGQQHMRSENIEDGWSDRDQIPNINVFTGHSGMTEEPELDANSSLPDFFYYFIDKDFINHMKEQTNLYARQVIQKKRALNQISPHSRLRNWTTVTQNDVRKFLAVILHMSISERPSITDHWSTDPVISCNFCPNLFSRDRFISILSHFHLNDNRNAKKKGEAGFDPLFKVRPMFETFRHKFRDGYQPAEDVTIDEGMCAFGGRLSFKQYMPQKPNRYGIKIYMLSESDSGYIWNFDVFCGQENIVTNVVLRLLDSLAGKGHTLFTDRYYTSPTLATELENIQTALVGTVQKNRRGMPKVLRNPKLQRGEQIYRRKENILALCWKDKREVYMISTRHTAEMVTFTNKRGHEVTKPAAVVNYNKKKCGVDLSDQRMSYGVFEHRTVKWWRKLAFHMILMCVSNACILYNQVASDHSPVSLTEFLKKVCSDLAVAVEEPSNPGASGTQLSRLSGKHFLERIPIAPGKKKAQRRCKVCAEKGMKDTGKARRKDTSYQCSVCNFAFCVTPCFEVFHSKKNYLT